MSSAVVDQVEDAAADLLHDDGHENFGDALWATLVAADPALRAKYLFALRSAHAELADLRDEQREREQEERITKMVQDAVAATLRPKDTR